LIVPLGGSDLSGLGLPVIARLVRTIDSASGLAQNILLLKVGIDRGRLDVRMTQQFPYLVDVILDQP
jgi:hypothetical protein